MIRGSKLKPGVATSVNNASVRPAKPLAYILVRDKDGKPKVDHPRQMPMELRKMLTPQERRDLGIPLPGDED